MVAALLHDIGKGELTEHSVAGEPIARAIAARIGFDDAGVDLVGRLVRRHLLLAETATTRDPDDPATAAWVAERVGSAEALSLLRALTEADARATAPKAWSSWRAEPGGRRGHAGRGRVRGRRGRRAAGERPAQEVAVPKAVRKGGTCIEVVPGGEGVAGHRAGTGPGRAAGRRRRAVRDAARAGTCGAGLEPGRRRRLGLGRRRGAPRPGRAAAALRRDHLRPRRPGRSGCGAGSARAWPRPSPYDPRPPRTRR